MIPSQPASAFHLFSVAARLSSSQDSWKKARTDGSVMCSRLMDKAVASLS